jgi:DeoR/GlpR family transcriptional regulator of sugar metabolism
MLKEERHQLILEKLNTDKKVNLVDISQLLNVSYDSIRRDIIELEDKGLLKKVHGGAIANSYLSMKASKGLGIANSEIMGIAKKAHKLIENHQTIIMDGGTTNFYIAEQLPKNLEATIITNNPHLAISLSEHSKIDVILLGGTFYKRYQISIGIETSTALEHINADLYFMGVNSISANNGAAIRNYEESLMKRRMMQSAKRTIVGVVEEKINIQETYKVCEFSQISCLISSLSPSDELLKDFHGQGVEIL